VKVLAVKNGNELNRRVPDFLVTLISSFIGNAYAS
jgi:hypothetical protein